MINADVYVGIITLHCSIATAPLLLLVPTGWAQGTYGAYNVSPELKSSVSNHSTMPDISHNLLIQNYNNTFITKLQSLEHEAHVHIKIRQPTSHPYNPPSSSSKGVAIYDLS